jgi:hypothetical protein
MIIICMTLLYLQTPVTEREAIDPTTGKSDFLVATATAKLHPLAGPRLRPPPIGQCHHTHPPHGHQTPGECSEGTALGASAGRGETSPSHSQRRLWVSATTNHLFTS